MDTPPGLDLLLDPRVKEYFLQLLARPLSGEEKYQNFVDYCLKRQFLPEGERFFNTPGLGQSSLESLPPKIQAAVARTFWRMNRSQHLDGGWGLQVETSNFWHSAYSILFLTAARDFPGVPSALLDEMILRGISYLEQHPEAWAADMVSQIAGMSIYEVGLMARCAAQVGQSLLRRESLARIYRSMDRLYRSQNEDGGWDANIWGYEVVTPVRIWSEVGATSAVLQALAETRNERFHDMAERAVHWLVSVQNPDGTWNNGSCLPSLPAYQLSGQPSINKTCDALQAIAAAARLGVPLQSSYSFVNRSINWLLEQNIKNLAQGAAGRTWGGGYNRADYENVCLILETLSRFQEVEPDSLALSAAWLVQTQRVQEDDENDGCWELGHTARIALTLIQFQQRIFLSQITE